MPLESGTQLGHYEISGPIGSGGMGPLGVPDPKGTVGPGILHQVTSLIPPVGNEG